MRRATQVSKNSSRFGIRPFIRPCSYRSPLSIPLVTVSMDHVSAWLTAEQARQAVRSEPGSLGRSSIEPIKCSYAPDMPFTSV